jgi:hypothetical protein
MDTSHSFIFAIQAQAGLGIGFVLRTVQQKGSEVPAAMEAALN